MEIKIKCSNCGAVLKVKDVPGLKDKSIRCPVCEELNPFAKYKEVKTVYDDETDIGNYKGTSGSDDETDIMGYGEDTVVSGHACLLDKHTNKKYELKELVNYVGRKATSTPEKVNVKIETSDMGFSRSHFCLEVVRQAGICKYKVYIDAGKNPTFINGEKIDKDDVLFVKDKDVIKSSNVELQFLLK